MPGPLTAADDYNFEDLDFGVDGTQVDDVNVDESPYGVDITGTSADYGPAYDRAIQRLRDQRSGMSGRERLGALLVGFGQPTRHGKWQESVVNASTGLFQQTLAQKAADDKRRELIARLELQRDIKGEDRASREKIAALKAAGAKTGTGKLNADQVRRLGYARRLNPDKSDEELIPLLYSDAVDEFMIRPGVVSTAAGSGNDVGSALEQLRRGLRPPPAPPTPALPAGVTAEQVQQAALKAKAEGRDTSLIVDRMRKWGVPIPEGLR